MVGSHLFSYLHQAILHLAKEKNITRFVSMEIKMKNNNEKKKLSRREWIILSLGTIILFGMIARFFPGVQAGFPLNDGGMFLSMINDLRASHYALPAETSYNNLGIPYAYPPFGFYFTRLLSDVFSFSEVALLRWLPPAVNTLSILVFYLLASLLLEFPQARRGCYDLLCIDTRCFRVVHHGWRGDAQFWLLFYVAIFLLGLSFIS